MRRLWVLVLCLVAIPCMASVAAEPVAPPSPAAVSFPGVAEVIPSLAQLTEQSVAAEAKASALEETVSFAGPLREARARQEDLRLRIAELGRPSDWSFDRLLEIRNRLADQQNALKRLLDGVSARLGDLDTLNQEWLDKRTYWQNWRKTLQQAQATIPRDAFRQAERTVDGLLSHVTRAFGPLVALQKNVTTLQEQNLEIINEVDATLVAIRGQTFKKTSPSLVNAAYYRQFTAELWKAVTKGVDEVQGIHSSFIRDNAWLIGLQLLLVFVIPFLIHRYRSTAEETTEWQFIFHHPWATGIFVALAAFSALYGGAPSLWRLALGGFAAASAAILIAGLLKNPRKRFMVYLLAGLYVISLALQTISLPGPLYRLYLSVLSLLGIPVFLLLASRNLKAKKGVGDGFTIALKVGALVLGVSLVAQIGGYSTLSFRLIESSVKSVFVSLFSAMAIRLGQGGIDFLLGLPFFARWRFFKRFGEELTERLKGVFQVLVVAAAGLYLLEIWGVYDTVSQAWSSLLALGFTIGTARVTLGMAFYVGLVLYLSSEFSWIVRSLLDAEFFPHRKFDRGVRDSIKKLLHYSVIFIGFLLAMAVAGVELKNFAVLAGAFGIGVGFGLQNIVNNFISGLILLFERPIKVGDMVVLDSEWGTVRKIGLRSTIVETFDKSEIIVPNSQLIAEKVTNWTLSTSAARVVVEVGVAYGSDLQKVLRILQEAAQHHPEVQKDPEPSSIFTGFGDSSLDFELRVWISDVAKRPFVKSEIGLFIDQRFREEGVEIPFPQRDLHVRGIDGAVFERFDSLGAGGAAPKTK